jgi:hypothetical protein
VVTVWLAPTGPFPFEGVRSAQVTLHQALPIQTAYLGPCRFNITAVGNVTLYARMDDIPGQGSTPGIVVVKADTTIAPTKPGATAIVAV